jgi:patatin-like phospholipase/acyl hydrolase
MVTHCPRILSLDGGGVRGLSSLLILREIMEEIGRRSEADETPLPCQYFDLIGGTSTGGLIAIMLGRLRMVIPIEIY